ncbi:MAG TPA: cyclopropane-fatty-acyl-phospholipid synthase family protein [Steroidobacteraceae bacterium]|jgi:cyclopropane-fatty-acyl-phospholipid synthase|nr:cyclopropane-fatty-acyl-phospholipid synthase family protein [Steroidobacteraceae bacterium]
MNAAEQSVRASDRTSESDAPALAEPRPAPRSIEARLLERLLSHLGNPPIEFLLWNGERVSSSGAEMVHRLRIADRATLFTLFTNSDLGFGDAYRDGRISIEGDLVDFLETVYKSAPRSDDSTSLLRRLVNRRRSPRSNTLEGSRDNIHRHYDIGNDFYSLWLGRTMAYTCAYYPTPSATLDEAQVAKMHHVCRKLQLQPGQSVVEAGCGWGSLGLHMARHYGVKVRAFNISHQQILYARERAQAEGLASQVEYVEDDYRNITGRYDAFVSVGMLEHVGLQNYPELGRVANRCLPRHGRGLIHSIGRNRPAPLHAWIERRIFPGAYPPSIAEMMRIFEPWDLSVLDVENLRLHYAMTLRHWLERYEAASGRVKSLFDEKFVRMWRLYLAGSVAAFTMGSLQLFQVVFAPRDNNEIPLTRAHLYAG